MLVLGAFIAGTVVAERGPDALVFEDEMFALAFVDDPATVPVFACEVDKFDVVEVFPGTLVFPTCATPDFALTFADWSLGVFAVAAGAPDALLFALEGTPGAFAFLLADEEAPGTLSGMIFC